MSEKIEEKNKKEDLLRLKEIRDKTKTQTITLMLTAFGFVAGLAWNEAIRSLIDTIFILNRGTLLAKFVYAVTVTIIVVIVSTYISGLNEKKN